MNHRRAVQRVRSQPGQRQPSRRVFLALVPPEPVRERLHRLARWSQHRVGGRLVPADNLHLTLLFLGELDAPMLDYVIRRVDEVPLAPQPIALQRLDYWPRAQILCAVGDPAAVPLQELYKGVRDRVKRAIRLEQRPFTPHVTLLRKVSELAALPMEPLSWQAEELTLLESVRDGAAVRYLSLECWSVAPARLSSR